MSGMKNIQLVKSGMGILCDKMDVSCKVFVSIRENGDEEDGKKEMCYLLPTL